MSLALPERRSDGGMAPGAEVVRLTRFVLVSLLTSVTCLVLVLVLHLVIAGSGWLLALDGLIAVNVLACALELTLIDRGRARDAVLIYAAADWLIALAVVAIVPSMLAVGASVVALPVVTAMPFLGRRGVELLAGVGAVVMVAVGCLGTLQDFTGLAGILPDWLETALLLVLLPFIWTYTALNASFTSARMVDARRAAEAANADLRASRARLVVAADTERRRIERNLHDGAQAHLLALRMRLAAARSSTASSTPASVPDDLLPALDRQVLAAIESLRALARGLYPPELVERGLPDALRSAAAVAAIPVTVRAAEQIGRLDERVEAAVYFCCVEAIQNAARHGGTPVRVLVKVWLDHGLRFEVSDDGVGFAAQDRGGTGLANLQDRIGALGGQVQVSSTPGAGVLVAGWVPLAGHDQPAGLVQGLPASRAEGLNLAGR